MRVCVCGSDGRSQLRSRQFRVASHFFPASPAAAAAAAGASAGGLVLLLVVFVSCCHNTTEHIPLTLSLSLSLHLPRPDFTLSDSRRLLYLGAAFPAPASAVSLSLVFLQFASSLVVLRKKQRRPRLGDASRSEFAAEFAANFAANDDDGAAQIRKKTAKSQSAKQTDGRTHEQIARIL